MMVYSHVWEARGQTRSHCEVEASHSYIERPCHKTRMNKQKCPITKKMAGVLGVLNEQWGGHLWQKD